LRACADLVSKRTIEWTLSLAFLWVIVLGSLALTTLGFGSSHVDYYERYGRAIGAGHLWLQQGDACDWDLSPYKGKCYSYWGIVPALFHWLLPFVSDRVMTSIATTVAVFFLLRCCLLLAQISDEEAGRTMPLLLFVTFFTGLPALAMVARVYEESIAFATAFGLAGIARLIPALHEKAPSLRRLLTGACLLSLAGLCRTPWFGVAFFAIGTFAVRALRSREPRALIAAAPIFLAVVAQLVLNQVRFENPFDFGYAYQTSNQQYIVANGHWPLSLRNVLPNLGAYLIGGLPPVENPLTTTHKLAELRFLPWTTIFTEGRPFQELGLALLIVMPSLLLAIPLYRKTGIGYRNAITGGVWTLPPSLAVLGIAGCIYRYELEAMLPVVLVAVPPLLSEAAARPSRFLKLHWLALCFGAPLVALNTLWIVKVICQQWGHC
jgi:hypothetical protein